MPYPEPRQFERFLSQSALFALAAILWNALPVGAAQISVGGRILTPHGRPAAGASVELLPVAVEPATKTDAIRGRTGVDGVFQLLAAAPGLWRVRVEEGGDVWEHPLHPLFHEVWLPPLVLGKAEPAAGVSDWRRVMGAPVAASGTTPRVSGRILDAATGRPLSGAWVWPTAAPGAAVRTTVTGRFDLRLDEQRGALMAAAPGYLVATRQPWSGDEDVRLQPAAMAAGQVLDAAGRPARWAALRLHLQDRAAPVADILCGPDGRFVIGGIPPGQTAELQARSASGQQDGFLVLEPLRPREDRRNLRIVVSTRGRDLIGQVLNEQSAPIPGAKIEMRPAAGQKRGGASDHSWRATTDALGSFALENLPSLEGIEIVVRHPDYSPVFLKEMEVPGAPLEIVLRSGAVLSGRVIDAEGHGASEAVVVVSAGAEHGLFSDEQQAVDQDGRFAFRHLSPATVTVRAVAPGFRAAERSGLELRRGVPLEDIELVLEPAAALRGTVRGADGSPAAGAFVSLRGAAVARSAMQADAEGTFTFEELPAGPVEVKAEHARHRPVERPIDLAVGDNRVELVLLPGLSIAGRVVDDRGMPLAEVELTAHEESALVPRSTRSHDDGSFRLQGLAPGRHELVAQAPGFIPVRRRLELGESSAEGLEITLEPGGAVRGRLIGLEPGELERVEVAAFAPQHGSVTGTVEATESYRINGLAPGDWTVTAVVAPGSRQARAAVRLGAGGETEIDLDFGEGLVLSGRVRVDDQPLAGGDVELFGLAGQGVASAVTGDDGTYELSGLASGQYRFRLRQRASGFAYEQPLEISTSRQLDLELGAARITGHVLAADGTSPLAGAGIQLQLLVPDGTGERLGSHSDSSGFFSLPRVQAGEYLLTVRLGERTALEQRLSVAPGIDQDLVLRLVPAGP